MEEILREVSAEKGGGKFVMAHVKDDPAVDARMKEFKATVRCIPLVDEFDGPGKCIVTGETVGSPRCDRQSLLIGKALNVNKDRRCSARTPACRVETLLDARAFP